MKLFIILLMVVFTGMSFASYTEPYTDAAGTVALWHMDSVRSNKYVDDDDSFITDRNANLILSPNPIDTASGPTLIDPLTAGIGYAGGNSAFGNCIYLDGVDDYCAIGNATLGIDPTNLKIEAWFKADSAADGQILFDRWGQIVIYANASNLTVATGAVSNSVNYSTFGANPTEWTHFAVEVEGDEMEVYLNDVLAGTFTIEGGLLSPSKTTTFIGQRYTGANKFAGYIDEFRISQVTPEPTMLALLGLGAMCLRRKKR